MIDNAEVQLGSTVYVEAHAGDEMEMSTLEGAATISAFGQSQTAVTGMKIGVPIDNDLKASGPPTAPETAEAGLLAALPVQELPQPVSATLTAAPADLSGVWTMTLGQPVTQGACGTVATLPPQTATMSADAAGNTLAVSPRGQPPLTLTNDGSGNYVGSIPPNNNGIVFHFVTPSHAEGEIRTIGRDVSISLCTPFIYIDS